MVRLSRDTLDETFICCFAGAPGELMVSGPCLARGYLNLPDLTAEAFVDVPGGTGVHSRMYKTGDLAAYNPDGTVNIMGRLDRQVSAIANLWLDCQPNHQPGTFGFADWVAVHLARLCQDSSQQQLLQHDILADCRAVCAAVCILHVHWEDLPMNKQDICGLGTSQLSIQRSR